MNEKKAIVMRDVKLRENVLMKNVYLWMILGLAVTAGISFAVSQSITLMRFVLLNPLVTIGIFIAQIVLVVMLSGRVERLRTGSAIALFLGYSALTGVTLSSIFLAYTGTSIAIAFVSALSVFAGGAIYGAVTKKSLKSWGGFLTMDEEHYLHLTDIGREVAEIIYERHCFFTEQLIAAGVDPKIAEADACRIEHVISSETFERLKEAAEQE